MPKCLIIHMLTLFYLSRLKNPVTQYATYIHRKRRSRLNEADEKLVKKVTFRQRVAVGRISGLKYGAIAPDARHNISSSKEKAAHRISVYHSPPDTSPL
jgi:hypothetical protein